jgi:hypothetical protein
LTDDNSNPVDINTDEDLETFETEFFKPVNHAEEVPNDEVEDTADEGVEDEESEIEDDALATDEDEDASAETEDDDEPEEEPEEEPKGKKNRKSYQERINELTAKAREAERREAEARRELEVLKTRGPEVKQEETVKDKLPADAPQPDAEDDKGEPLYPLGEFDPKFIAALTRFTIEQEMAETRKRQAVEAQQKEIEAAKAEIQDTWKSNLERAEEDLPDIREKISDLVTVFQDVEESYGEYLASTIMSLETGPEIMYYLSQNIGEAQKIVASGAAAATRAIGRLEARFEQTTPHEPKRNKRVSDAPEPPEQRSRGTNGKFAVRPDTDDLDAFENDFFKRKP